MTACVAPLTTVVLDAAPCDLGGSASGVNSPAARLGGLVAVAALEFAFGGTSASDVASVGGHWTVAHPRLSSMQNKKELRECRPTGKTQKRSRS